MIKLGSLDSSCNLQANYANSFLFRLNLILHACKILIRCDNFGILNFTTKQGLGNLENLFKPQNIPKLQNMQTRGTPTKYLESNYYLKPPINKF